MNFDLRFIRFILINIFLFLTVISLIKGIFFSCTSQVESSDDTNTTNTQVVLKKEFENQIVTFFIDSQIKASLTNEAQYNSFYASLILGKTEIEKEYLEGEKVLIDIELVDEVIEGGLDKRSSLDSVQQAIFFAHLTGKKPVVAIYDTDNEVGIYEHQIGKVCEELEINFRNIRFVEENCCTNE